MDPKETGQLIGQILVFILLALIPTYAAKRARRAEPRSRRLAGYALTCGLLMLPALAALAAFRGTSGRPVFIGVGAFIVSAGFAALYLAFSARSARKSDGGSSAANPFAVLLGLGCVIMGAGAILMPFITNPRDEPPGSPGSTAWAYKVDPPGFQVTLTSDRWKKDPRPLDIARFGCPRPQMGLIIKEVRPATDAAGFETAVNDLKRLVTQFRTTSIEEKRGPNANGHQHWMFVGEEKRERRVLVAVSVTWWNKTHAVIMLFEGQYQMASQAGQEQETEAYLAAATTILGSVK